MYQNNYGYNIKFSDNIIELTDYLYDHKKKIEKFKKQISTNIKKCNTLQSSIDKLTS